MLASSSVVGAGDDEDGVIRTMEALSSLKNLMFSYLRLQRRTRMRPPCRTDVVALSRPTSPRRHARQSPADRSGVHCAVE